MTRADTQNTQAVSDGGLIRGAIGLAVISMAGFGFLYPMAGVGLGQALFSDTANGSLLKRDGKVVGSALVAQPFEDARYFQSRPSAAGFDPMAVAGSNQARTNPEMVQRVEEAVRTVAKREGVAPADVPSDLVTQSGGGIDPHISPQAAAIQVAGVARERGLSVEQVNRLLKRHTEGAQFGMLGQPRVNVLSLNLALDQVTNATAK